MTPPSTEIFAFCTQLASGRELDYERFHRSIPAELDRAMREAGVLGWRIHRQGTTLTHLVEVRDRARMEAVLSTDPANRSWQEQVVPFLAPSPGDAPPPDQKSPGALIWDLSWPTR
jgi:L-rhamnose mutarotase